MFGAAANPGGWTWNLVSRDQDELVATVGLPVGIDDTILSGPIGVKPLGPGKAFVGKRNPTTPGRSG
jgi:hypothetical protein